MRAISLLTPASSRHHLDPQGATLREVLKHPSVEEAMMVDIGKGLHLLEPLTLFPQNPDHFTVMPIHRLTTITYTSHHHHQPINQPKKYDNALHTVA